MCILSQKGMYTNNNNNIKKLDKIKANIFYCDTI